jgi:hypothetical protein
MEKDPMNITHCPYGIFVMETEDGVMVLSEETSLRRAGRVASLHR